METINRTERMLKIDTYSHCDTLQHKISAEWPWFWVASIPKGIFRCWSLRSFICCWMITLFIASKLQ